MLQRLLGLSLIWLTLAAGCTAVLPVQDAYEPVTLTPLPTDTPAPTPVRERADAAGVAFLRAWEAGDFIGMYDMTTAGLQALIDSDTFIKRYRDAQTTARVTTVTAQPLGLVQDGDRATLEARVIWETAVVGSIVREHAIDLVFENGGWAIDWHEGLVLPELAGGNRLDLVLERPARAAIFDRDGATLAFQGENVRTLGVLPQRFDDEAGLLAALSQVLDRPADDIRAVYADLPEDWYTPIETVPVSLIQDNFELLSPYFSTGLQVAEENGRIYPSGVAGPHLVGYMGPISAEAWPSYADRGYAVDDRVGISGLEAAAEEYLAGTPGGRLVLLDPAGDYISAVQQVESVPARNVYTTFAADFQRGVEQILANAIETHPAGAAGAAVVLDVRDGSVRAMATYPSYDGAVFSEIRRADGSELTAVLNNPRLPLLNRATLGEYPAGSTFKIVTTAAGLYSGVFQPESTILCTGVWTGLGPDNPKYDWLEGGHGRLNLSQALTRSCNPFYYEIGFTLDGVDPNVLPDMARHFGLGATTGIDVAESAGVIPDPDWKWNALGEGWVAGDSVNMAIGQGFVLVTPLQIANVSAAIANGGTVYRPNLIERVSSVRGVPELIVQPEVLRQLPLSAEQIATIRASMDDVTDGPFGTAVGALGSLLVPTAGKTGTAEAPTPDSLPHAWFTGFAPVDTFTTPAGATYSQPEIAIAVVIENAGEGSAVAAPIFRQIVELYFDLALTPLPWE